MCHILNLIDSSRLEGARMGSILYTKSANDREYFITIKTEYMLLERKYLTNQKDLKKWENRVTLAKENNRDKLQAEAENQVEIIQNKIKHLINQLIELKVEVRKALKSITESTEQLSIDPDKLLKDLERLIGDSTMNLEKDINTLKAENELEQLKNKIQGN